jgi:hypothetical protein
LDGIYVVAADAYIARSAKDSGRMTEVCDMRSIGNDEKA